MTNSENPDSNEIAAESEQRISTEPFAFHGSGSDYFRIWIVNLLFSILTLGIYSAWAKVRTRRYFYGNTELAGDRFGYLANPIAILKGRLIAVSALIVYTVASNFNPIIGGFLALILALVIPIVIVQALRFNSGNSAWRGVRFGFDGSFREAYGPHLLWPLFGVITLGLGFPYALYKANQFQFNNYRYGLTNSSSSATAGGFYRIALAVFGATILSFALVVVLTIMLAFGGGGDGEIGLITPFLITIYTILITYFVLYVFIVVLYQAMYFRLVFNNLEIGGSRVHNSVSKLGYIRLMIVNTILIMVTLGFFYPWAAVRRARYLLSNMWLEARSLDSFVAGEADHVSAQGDEFGEAFDLGIGF